MPGACGIGILLGLFFFCPEPFAAKALDWPSSGGSMVSNFGFNLKGLPAVGVSFETEEPVRAAEAGEMFFSRSGDNTASRLPSPMGSWLALDHGDGLISIYSRFDETSGDRAAASGGPDLSSAQVDRNAIIARAGSSGWSAFKGFFFAIFDRRERRWVNPAMIIAPLPDTRPPQIVSVTLIAEDGRRIGLLRLPQAGAQAAALPGRISQGRYRIAVEATDTRLEAGEKELAPHRILCLVNGVETGALNFETYSARDGVLMVDRNGLTPVEKVYAPYPAFEVGNVWLTRGQTTLEVIVQDVAGNERSATIRFTVE
ncbi:MAG: M23 family metallopeptidase [Treponema sp.]|jgi:hypothetical protein|nr:M23 family metallopeptidase [Treponema sp.]